MQQMANGTARSPRSPRTSTTITKALDQESIAACSIAAVININQGFFAGCRSL